MSMETGSPLVSPERNEALLTLILVLQDSAQRPS